MREPSLQRPQPWRATNRLLRAFCGGGDGFRGKVPLPLLEISSHRLRTSPASRPFLNLHPTWPKRDSQGARTRSARADCVAALLGRESLQVYKTSAVRSIGRRRRIALRTSSHSAHISSFHPDGRWCRCSCKRAVWTRRRRSVASRRTVTSNHPRTRSSQSIASRLARSRRNASRDRSSAVGASFVHANAERKTGGHCRGKPRCRPGQDRGSRIPFQALGNYATDAPINFQFRT